jgi:hypothetical protein
VDSSTNDLIADLHARHDAWRRQGEDLARLHADARAAAGREAAAIVAVARAEVSRIVEDARRALVVLTAQLHAIPEAARLRLDQGEDSLVPDSVLQAQRDLERLFDDVAPDLDEVTAQAAQFGDPFRAVTTAVTTPAVVAPSFLQIDDEQMSPFAVNKRVLIAFAIVAASFAGGGAWWVWDARADDLTPPLAAIPPVPRLTPSWMEQPIPTLTASVVSIPAAPAATEPSGPARAPSAQRP